MNSKKPFFSIITPIFNGSEYVENYIKSLKNQTYTDWEAILIDDHSIDNTLQVIHENVKKDKRFRIIKLQEKKIINGPYLARNRGIENAKGEFICFLDIDDLWKPSKLERHLYLIKQNPNTKLIFASYLRNKKDTNTFKVRHPFLLGGVKNVLQYANVIPMLTTCLKKEVIKDIRFKPINHEDYLFWLEITAKLNNNQILYDNQINSIYCIHKDSVSSSKLKAILWIWRVYQERNYNLLKSVKCIFIRSLIQILIILKENLNHSIRNKSHQFFY